MEVELFEQEQRKYFLLFIKNPAQGRGLEGTYHLDFWISSSTHNLDRSACNACRMGHKWLILPPTPKSIAP